MFCQNCGKQLNDGANFCPNCGQKIIYDEIVTSSDNLENTDSNTNDVATSSYYYIGTTPVSKEACDEIDALLTDNKKTQAINYVRQLTGLELTYAKDFIEQHSVGIWDKNAPVQQPPTTNTTDAVANTQNPGQSFQTDNSFAQPKKKKGCLSKILTVFLVLIVLSFIGRLFGGNSSSSSRTNSSSSSKPSSSSSSSKPSSSSSSSSSSATSTKTPAPTQTYMFDIASKKTNMKVGEINVDGSFYVGLSGVRVTNVLYTALDWNTEDIPAGQEVVYVLLEVYNGSGKIKSYSSNNISVYADSNKAADPDTYLLVGIDGYQAYSSNELDPGTKSLVVDAYLVPKGWKELTVFANDLSWVLTPQDVLQSTYTYSSLFDASTPSDFTKYRFGDVIYSEDYTVIYDGCVAHTHNNMITGNEDYVVFKFTINNTSSETLDYSLVGYNMRGYQDLRLLDDATYVMDDNVDGYTNIYKVDEVKPGMTAKVYVAFEDTRPGGLYTCAFDTGYIINDLLAYVSAQG